MECLFKTKGKLVEVDEDANKIKKEKNEYEIMKKPKLVSKYDTKLTEEKKKKEEEQKKKAFTIDDDEPDQLVDDNFIGNRLHCWVLLKAGPRGVD